MIRVENLQKTYRMGAYEVQALRGVSLEIARGEFIAIMGPSGSGKSTLMHILGCLDKPDAGRYYFNGVELSSMSNNQLAWIRNASLGFIFQNFSLLPRSTAMNNVELPLVYGNVPDRKILAAKALASVGLGNRVHHRPNELSGGQQQRVAIARALVNNPHILFADEPTGNLDLQSGKEIMQIIKNLNERGITTVLVTHDTKIAEYANRILVVNDGKIVNDERKKIYALPPARPAAAHGRPAEPARDGGRGGPPNAQEIFESIYMSVRGLLANKMRSILAMLGVIIGVSAVIIMISFAQGAKKDITKKIENMGSNLLSVMAARGQGGVSRVASAVGSSGGLTINDVEAIQEKVAGIRQLSPTMSGSAQVVFGTKNTNTRILGTYPAYLEIRNFTVKTGRNFTEQEMKGRYKVALIGNSVKDELFDTAENPVGKSIKIGSLRFTVIGTLAAKGSSGMGDEDDQIIIPFSTAQKRLFGREDPSDVQIQVADKTLMDQASAAITAVLRTMHHLADDDEDDFRVRSQAEILSMVSSTSQTFSMLLGGIASVSLLVGGIGIMNIMLVSVTERTREIGIRKAVGAQYRDILLQFLVEAVVICVIGGLLGVAFGVLVSLGINATGKWTTALSPLSILVSFFFALIVGVVFGLYPAVNAAKLNPIQALRYE